MGLKRPRKRQRPSAQVRQDAATVAGDAHSAAGILHDSSLSLASNDDQASVAQALGCDNRRPRGSALEGLFHVLQYRR